MWGTVESFFCRQKKKKLVTMSARIKFSAPTIIIHGHCGIFLLQTKKEKAGYHVCTDKIQRANDNHTWALWNLSFGAKKKSWLPWLHG
mmetsp:Transcript_22568/g.27615  ORF Transcript_22568/g.27615 Transcript_22568/m.27615 type:complete len:88 (+) Transcript_22568:235-498(+)